MSENNLDDKLKRLRKATARLRKERIKIKKRSEKMKKLAKKTEKLADKFRTNNSKREEKVPPELLALKRFGEKGGE